MNQGIIDITPCVTLIQEFLNTYQRYFHFQYHQHTGQSKYFKTSLSPC